MLQPGVGVRVAVGELEHVVLPVEAEGERHDVVASVIGTAIVIHVLGGKSLPATEKHKKFYLKEI